MRNSSATARADEMYTEERLQGINSDNWSFLLKVFGGLQVDCLCLHSRGNYGSLKKSYSCLMFAFWTYGLRGHSSDINEDVASGVSEELTSEKRTPPPPRHQLRPRLVDVFSLGEV
ncbi:hypothetical protein CesoFtcFv8_027602 [Champsocephalus esox]|uniref:Uncharacterized protein n=1 Tax=Champsocephalus esox TaxID=159716 RepID=A0AAN7Y3D1_9TELE|nr:hypothetical protein CesoFtcFv8_027602 [Champsocephalus esox]